MTRRSLVLAALGAAALAGCNRADDPAPTSGRQASAMELTSTAFADGQAIPAEFTCDGAGRSPPLQWRAPPAGTLGFALIVEDPDAPGGTFRHWGLYDLSAKARQLDAGAAQAGVKGLEQTANDFGNAGYGPPCPPRGDKAHRYRFRLLALDVARLPGSPVHAQDILDETAGHVLGSAELVGLYGRR